MLVKFLDGTSREIAKLQGTYLSGADLQGADLQGASLWDADLRGANLRDANLQGANGLAQQCIVSEGDIIGYKKLQQGIIATIKIPAGISRLNAYGSRKCRAASAYVIALSEGTFGIAQHDGETWYVVGETVLPDSFNSDKREECSNGIHFFITREEAEAY